MEFTKLLTNGVKLHLASAGPVDGEPIIFLHGFPEFWYGWRKQIDYFTRRGYRVLVPDQRGYNLSDKPMAISDYGLDELSADVEGLIDIAARGCATVVGHDWGGAVAWRAAMLFPEKINRLVVINVPHPAVMNRALKKNFRQKRRSWYMMFFQLPLIPELLLSMGNYRYMRLVLVRSSWPGTFTDEDLRQYVLAWSHAGALNAMLNWYRGMMHSTLKPVKSRRIKVPTLMIWGTADPFLGQEMARPSIRRCLNGRLELVPGATHWVQHEESSVVNGLIADHIRGV